MRAQFNDLADHVENGWPVPDEFYRSEIGRNKDALLAATGVKHLHLNGSGSNEIVYLVELPDRVVVLLIDDHKYLEDDPRGSLIRKLFGLPHW